jgi:hypothetical protein
VRQEISRCAGSQFDPEVVSAFLRIPAPEWDDVARGAVPPNPPEQSIADLQASFRPPR